LRGERRTYQRPGSGDRCEVVAEDNPLVRRLEVMPVPEALGRSGAPVVQHHHLRSNECGVEPVPDQVSAAGRQHQPHAVHRLATIDGDGCERESGENGYAGP
jgi:hypothetical protein